jgi:hypothetical protein
MKSGHFNLLTTLRIERHKNSARRRYGAERAEARKILP